MMIGMVFMAFVVLRSFGAGGDTEKRFASGLAIVGSFLIPIIHWSVQRWRGQHPTVVTGRGGGLHADMYPAFFTGMGVFTLLVIFLVWARYRAERTKHAVTALEDRMADLGILEDA
jgi:heme exporter protein C